MFNWKINEEKAIRNKISIILFICSILVIFIHTYNLEVYGIEAGSLGLAHVVYNVETFWSKVTKIAVPIFFLVSGFLFFRTFEIKELFNKWENRIKTILVPYIIWCTLYYLYFVLCTNIPAIAVLFNPGSVVPISLKEWALWLWTNEYYTLWFLKNLIVFIALTPIIWLLLNNHFKKVPTGLIALIIIIFIKLKYGTYWTYGSGMEVYLIGSYIGLNCRELIKRNNVLLSIIALAYIALTLVTSFRYWNLGTQIILYLSIWFVLDLFDLSSIAIPWWMSITFFTYVAHDVLLEMLEKVFYIVFGSKPLFALIDYLFMPFVVEAILIRVAFLLRKYLPTIWKITTGGR